MAGTGLPRAFALAGALGQGRSAPRCPARGRPIPGSPEAARAGAISLSRAGHYSARSLTTELLGDPCHVLTLKACNGQLIFSRLAGAIHASDRRSAVGGSSADFIHCHEPFFREGHPHDDHAKVKESGVEARDRRLLPTMLTCSGHKDACHLPDQSTAEPEARRRVDKTAHRSAHVSVAGWCSEEDRIGLHQPLGLRNGHVLKPRLGRPAIVWTELGHSVQTDLCTLDVANSLFDGFGHSVDVAVRTIEDDLSFHLDSRKIPGQIRALWKFT